VAASLLHHRALPFEAVCFLAEPGRYLERFLQLTGRGKLADPAGNATLRRLFW